jgi:acetyltransferase-like isoleucine patch superfamily enzyme
VSLVGRATLGVYRHFVRARNKAFSLLSSGAFAEYGANTVIELPIRLSGESRIAIGARTFIGAGAWLQALEHPDGGDGVVIRIGDDCGFAGGSVFSAVKSLTIGNHVYFARGCYVADHTHAYDDADANVENQGLTDIRPVAIEDGVWLGENVVVLPGVRIGRGTVVGANSVVNVDLPEYCVALGVPARIVRRFGPDDDAAE